MIMKVVVDHERRVWARAGEQVRAWELGGGLGVERDHLDPASLQLNRY
jgi:hypothetical protein